METEGLWSSLGAGGGGKEAGISFRVFLLGEQAARVTFETKLDISADS